MVNYTNPNRPTADTHLVERVRWVIGSAEVEDENTPEWTEEAVAAIQEIAAWLHDHQYWENAAAVLYAELDDFRKAQ
jgi:ABC-type nitrate/sulfonate/bicarbonate transport system substrate-binding protein